MKTNYKEITLEFKEYFLRFIKFALDNARDEQILSLTVYKDDFEIELVVSMYKYKIQYLTIFIRDEDSLLAESKFSLTLDEAIKTLKEVNNHENKL